jgi:RimJ/RimL family protein N-acetyltransferase/predicted CoA-binding protein
MVASAVGPAPLVRDVLLRDGWTLRLQTPMPVDFEDIRAFYDGLSEDSRYLRFHGFGRTDAAARADAEASGVDRLALIGRHEGRVVAVASYDGLREPGVAEVAFAVADEDQRRGIGMRMLEQLAALAAERGTHRFVAEVVGRNELMLGVFEHAGFAVRRRGSDGEVMVSLDITLTKALQDRIDERDHVASIASLRPLLAPRSVAVVGASEDPASVGGRVLRSIIVGGFRGLVWPVNRSGGIVCSAGAVRALADLPEPPELAVIAVPAVEVAGVVEEAGRIGVRAVLVISAGFADAGERGSELQRELLEIVRAHGMRMVGPNSLGSPIGRRACVCTRQWRAGGRCRGAWRSCRSRVRWVWRCWVRRRRAGWGWRRSCLSVAARTCRRTTSWSTGRTMMRLRQSCCTWSRSVIRSASPGSLCASRGASRSSSSRGD